MARRFPEFAERTGRTRKISIEHRVTMDLPIHSETVLYPRLNPVEVYTTGYGFSFNFSYSTNTNTPNIGVSVYNRNGSYLDGEPRLGTLQSALYGIDGYGTNPKIMTHETAPFVSDGDTSPHPVTIIIKCTYDTEECVEDFDPNDPYNTYATYAPYADGEAPTPRGINIFDRIIAGSTATFSVDINGVVNQGVTAPLAAGYVPWETGSDTTGITMLGGFATGPIVWTPMISWTSGVNGEATGSVKMMATDYATDNRHHDSVDNSGGYMHSRGSFDFTDGVYTITAVVTSGWQSDGWDDITVIVKQSPSLQCRVSGRVVGGNSGDNPTVRVSVLGGYPEPPGDFVLRDIPNCSEYDITASKIISLYIRAYFHLLMTSADGRGVYADTFYADIQFGANAVKVRLLDTSLTATGDSGSNTRMLGKTFQRRVGHLSVVPHVFDDMAYGAADTGGKIWTVDKSNPVCPHGFFEAYGGAAIAIVANRLRITPGANGSGGVKRYQVLSPGQQGLNALRAPAAYLTSTRYMRLDLACLQSGNPTLLRPDRTISIKYHSNGHDYTGAQVVPDRVKAYTVRGWTTAEVNGIPPPATVTAKRYIDLMCSDNRNPNVTHEGGGTGNWQIHGNLYDKLFTPADQYQGYDCSVDFHHDTILDGELTGISQLYTVQESQVTAGTYQSSYAYDISGFTADTIYDIAYHSMEYPDIATNTGRYRIHAQSAVGCWVSTDRSNSAFTSPYFQITVDGKLALDAHGGTRYGSDYHDEQIQQILKKFKSSSISYNQIGMVNGVPNLVMDYDPEIISDISNQNVSGTLRYIMNGQSPALWFLGAGEQFNPVTSTWDLIEDMPIPAEGIECYMHMCADEVQLSPGFGDGFFQDPNPGSRGAWGGPGHIRASKVIRGIAAGTVILPGASAVDTTDIEPVRLVEQPSGTTRATVDNHEYGAFHTKEIRGRSLHAHDIQEDRSPKPDPSPVKYLTGSASYLDNGSGTYKTLDAFAPFFAGKVHHAYFICKNVSGKKLQILAQSTAGHVVSLLRNDGLVYYPSLDGVKTHQQVIGPFTPVATNADVCLAHDDELLIAEEFETGINVSTSKTLMTGANKTALTTVSGINPCWIKTPEKTCYLITSVNTYRYDGALRSMVTATNFSSLRGSIFSHMWQGDELVTAMWISNTLTLSRTQNRGASWTSPTTPAYFTGKEIHAASIHNWKGSAFVLYTQKGGDGKFSLRCAKSQDDLTTWTEVNATAIESDVDDHIPAIYAMSPHVSAAYFNGSDINIATSSDNKKWNRS